MNKSNPQISVIIPIHNGEKTLERSLKSVIDQTYQDFEIITVLNNCTDNSESICKKFNTKILYCNEQGIVPALNTGLLNAQGKYIARQDADDYWYPEKLEKQFNFMLENPNTDILGTQIRILDKNLNENKSQEKRPLDNDSIKKCLLNSMNVIAHPSVLFKKSIFLRTGFYSDVYPFAEDYELWLKSIKFFNFSNLPDVLVDYTLTYNPNYNPEIHKIVCLNYNILYNKLI
jgi:glycosyltransferase involved in cell wall biosynthesis